MVVLSSMFSYIILAGSSFDVLRFLFLTLGGLFITFAANALNQSLERDYDKLMTRTAFRPVASGRMSLSMAVLVSGVFCSLGVIFLALLSPEAATLGMLSFVLYAFVYTPLKRYSTVAIPVGAIPGALPTLIAGVVACNGFTSEALCLFGLQYLWQFPHFWSIAWIGHEDYKKAGFKLIRDIEGKPDPKYGLYAAYYSAMSLILIVFYTKTSALHPVIIAGLVLLVGLYSWMGLRLYSQNNASSARQLMFSSFFYLPLMFLFFYLNKFLIF